MKLLCYIIASKHITTINFLLGNLFRGIEGRIFLGMYGPSGSGNHYPNLPVRTWRHINTITLSHTLFAVIRPRRPVYTFLHLVNLNFKAPHGRSSMDTSIG